MNLANVLQSQWHPSVALLSLRMAVSPTPLSTSTSTLKAQSSDWASRRIFTISTAWIAVCFSKLPIQRENIRSLYSQRRHWRNLSLLSMSFVKQGKPSISVFRNVQLRPCAGQTQVSHRINTRSSAMYADRLTVAKIDAVQAEYSPFETLHEDDGLIPAARELDIAFIAYGPLGHGWLVEDFPYNSPEDFNEDDYRRQSM